MKSSYKDFVVPESKKVNGKICNIGDLTLTNADLDPDIHKGFTIGKNGRQMYFMMIWHSWGNVTVFTTDEDNREMRKRWLKGDTEITVHFH